MIANNLFRSSPYSIRGPLPQSVLINLLKSHYARMKNTSFGFCFEQLIYFRIEHCFSNCGSRSISGINIVGYDQHLKKKIEYI